MRSSVERQTILVCSGSHCRKALQRDDRVEETLSRLPIVVERVRCQKVCKGPVVGLSIDGTWQWFRRMDSRKAMRALAELVEDGTIAKPLLNRLDRKRAGKLRS